MEGARYVVKEWRSENDHEGVAHSFSAIGKAIGKAEALGKSHFDAYDETGKWYPVQRAQDGTWSPGLTVAERIGLEEASVHAVQPHNMAARADGRSTEAIGQNASASTNAAREHERTGEGARDALTPHEKAVLEQSRSILSSKSLGEQFTAAALRELEVKLRSDRAPASRVQAAATRKAEHQFDAEVQRKGRER